MKKVVVTILILSSFSISAQENKVAVQPTPKAIKMDQPKPESSDRVQQNQNISPDENYPKTVSYTRGKQNQTPSPRTLEAIETDIFNIKAKMEHVRNSPEMDAKARAEGWYEQNEELLRKLDEEKTNLLKK